MKPVALSALAGVLLILGFVPASQAVEILRWERLPLPVPLVVGQERVVFIDRNVRIGVPAGVAPFVGAALQLAWSHWLLSSDLAAIGEAETQQALELFKLPRTVGQFEGTDVVIGAGRFGPYVMHNKKYVSLPKGEDPMTVTLDTAIQLIQTKRLQEEQRHMKKFEEDAKLEILNGRYGPYIAYDGKNYRIPKAQHDKATELTYEQCMDIVNATPAKKK